jgi:P4 family phage/plasmid primase-like protien
VDKSSLAVANGVLSYEESAWVIRPHRREDFRTTLIPLTYDPQAQAPRFIQFLHEVFQGTKDRDFRIKGIQQALGYTLIASCHLERFFMLIGRGANGKSVLLKVVEALVGSEQVCAVQPSQFENRFQRAHLDGKLANIITEIAEGAQMADAQLKALVSGELSTAEQKFQPPFDFYPIATHWYGTNHMPNTRDFSDALFRRAMIIEFPNTFLGDQQDVRLFEKLQAELSGILNFALAGLADLLTTGQFVTVESSNKAIDEWRLEADQVAQFVTDKTCRTKGEFVAADQLYSSYRSWAEDAGIHRLVSKKTFGTRLERLGYARARGTKGSRGYRDIELGKGRATIIALGEVERLDESAEAAEMQSVTH